MLTTYIIIAKILLKKKQYKHVPPIINKFPVHSYCHTINSAICHARGEVILLTLDYRYFMPTTLQKHANFHMSHANNYGYAPGSKFVLAPSIKTGLPSYGYNADYDRYIKDLKDGKLQNYMWSMFGDEFTKDTPDPSHWQELDRSNGYDPKMDILPGTEVTPMYVFLNNESIKTKIILGANGLNEELDGAHSHQDIEFGHRLRNLYDFKWIADNTNITYRTNSGHGIVSKLKLIKEIDDNATAIFTKYQNGSKDSVNNWSLAEVHAENQKLCNY